MPGLRDDCSIPGCHGFIVPDITGRPMCYKCGPRDMLPTYYTSDYPQYDGKVKMPVEESCFKDVPQSIIDEVDKYAGFREVMGGKKYDQGKLRWHLMPWAQLHQVALVMEHGANKYGEENWKLVVGAYPRYFDAAMRHIVADELYPGSVDDESGISHLAHAVCCLLFMMYFEKVHNAQPASPSGL
jgi:hypothetical protein